MNLAAPKILVVEDETSQVELLRYNLQQQGFTVCVAMDGEAGILMAREELPDLILLDWMLPNLSGIEVCRQLRQDAETRDIPVILLTARSEERDKVRGLDVGADDYVSKPYSIKELIARIRARLRRSNKRVHDSTLSLGDLVLDLEKHSVSFANQPLQTSPTEYRLLITLMQSPGRVYSRGQLLDQVWGMSSDLDTRTVDVHVGRLRRLLKPAGCADMLRTVRGFGYSIELIEK